jgi:hypothetical protein
MNTTTEHPSLQPIIKLNRDLMSALTREIPGGVTTNEARFLVDQYYTIQKARIGNSNRCKGLDRDAEKSENEPEPHEALDRFSHDFAILEENTKKILGWWVDSHPMSWFFDNTLGVGPVLAAGLLAHIDIERCETEGQVWAFAGLDPSKAWGKGEKRPHNTALKTICWKIGDSFVKLSGRADSFYSRIYKERKVYEWQRNLSGGLSEQATASMERKKYGKATDQHAWYTGGCDPEKVRAQLELGKTPTAASCKGDHGVPMLSPAHIDARARRYAVKLFLSHLFECWRAELGLPYQRPYVIAHGGHAHYVAPPQRAGRLEQAA